MQQIKLIFQIDTVAHRCIRAVIYFDATTGKGANFWAFTQNCYGEIACLNWCHIFKSYSNDPAHYNNLFGNDALIHIDQKFAHAQVKQQLIMSICSNEVEYEQFRKQVVDFRNKYVSHRDYHQGSITFPNLNKAKKECELIRDILRDCVSVAAQIDPEYAELEELNEHLTWNNNQQLVNECEEDANKIIFFD